VDEANQMMRSLTVLLAGVMLCGSAVAQEKKGKNLQLKELPAAVQKTVQENLKGGQIKNIGKEKEDGIVEEGTTIDAIPAPAKASILKKVSDGKLGTVETFTKPGQAMMYEAAYTDKKGKHHEVLVKADGTETKE
jgi:hypothetical protein